MEADRQKTRLECLHIANDRANEGTAEEIVKRARAYAEFVEEVPKPNPKPARKRLGPTKRG